MDPLFTKEQLNSMKYEELDRLMPWSKELPKEIRTNLTLPIAKGRALKK